MTAKQALAERWRLTREILDQKGLEIPRTIEFQIDGANHIRATRVATLEELARAVAALDEVIERHREGNANVLELRGRPKIEELNKQRDALAELQKLAGHDESPSSTTVIEALFPDIPVQKRTLREKAEIEQWLAVRKEEALKINPETAEVDWSFAQTLDPYGVMDEWELPEEFHQVGREYFARAPGSDIWVHFGDLPDEVREKLWKHPNAKPSFTVKSNGQVIWNIDLPEGFEPPF